MLATRLKNDSNRKQISKKICKDFKESQVDWASLAALPTNWRLRKPHPPAAPADPKLDCPKSKIESCIQSTCHCVISLDCNITREQHNLTCRGTETVLLSEPHDDDHTNVSCG